MKVAVVGSRRLKDFAYVFSRLSDFMRPDDVIISGGAAGVDSAAAMYAVDNKHDLLIFLPNGVERQDYLDRNMQIADACDVLIAFPDGKSTGTWHTVMHAKNTDKRVILFRLPEGLVP